MEMSAARGGLQLPLENVPGKVQHQLCQEKVGDQDEHGSGDYRLRGRSSNSLRSAPHRQSLIAPNRRYDKSENDRLGESLHQVGKLQDINRSRPKSDRTEP